MGRGCSTKDKVFYKECETHNYGDSLEKMCFCSFQLCNTSNQLKCPSNITLWTITLIVFLLSSKTWIWDPWPPFSHCKIEPRKNGPRGSYRGSTPDRIVPGSKPDDPVSSKITPALPRPSCTTLTAHNQFELATNFTKEISDNNTTTYYYVLRVNNSTSDCKNSSRVSRVKWKLTNEPSDSIECFCELQSHLKNC